MSTATDKASQVSDVNFSDVLIGQNRGKGEKEYSDCDKDITSSTVYRFHCHLRKGGSIDFSSSGNVLHDELTIW